LLLKNFSPRIFAPLYPCTTEPHPLIETVEHKEIKKKKKKEKKEKTPFPIYL
jgi:hypothetical protein